jgi:hypothetical protein
MKSKKVFYVFVSFVLLLAYFLAPSHAQVQQPNSPPLGEQAAQSLGMTKDELIDKIKWIGMAITIFICYKGGAFNIGPKKNDRDKDEKK